MANARRAEKRNTSVVETVLKHLHNLGEEDLKAVREKTESLLHDVQPRPFEETSRFADAPSPAAATTTITTSSSSAAGATTAAQDDNNEASTDVVSDALNEDLNKPWWKRLVSW